MWDPYAEFEVEVLPNGLTVYAAEWPGREWEAIGFVVHVGSKDEPNDQEGLSHFVEHMVSHNTGLTDMEINGILKDSGGWAKLGSTGIFGSHYSFFAPLQEEILSKALSIFGAMLFGDLTSSGLELERSAVTAEFNKKFVSKLSLDLYRAKNSALYSGMPQFLKRPIGHPDIFAKMTFEDLRQFHASNYVPQNISVVAVGGMEPKEVFRLLEKKLVTSRNGYRNQPLAPFSSAPIPSPLRNVVEVKKYTSTEINCWELDVSLLIPGTLSDVLFIFHPMLRDTLYDLLRTEKKWVYDISIKRENLVEFIEFGFYTQFPLEISVETAEQAVEEGLKKALSDRTLFESWKKKRIAQGRLTDLSGEELLKNAINELVRKQRIVSNAEDIAAIMAVPFDELQELAKWFAPERRYTQIIIP